MRVTNEQIRAEIICTQREACDGCPFYGVDNCDNLRGNDFDMYKDLLEARELIKEMREEINLTLRDFEKIDEVCKIANVMPFSLTKRKLFELLEKTKEYAE
jgi:hypothetical protein